MGPRRFASALVTELDSLPEQSTGKMRAVRRAYSKKLLARQAEYVLAVATEMISQKKHRWIAYELIRDHGGAFLTLDRVKLESLGQGMDHWSSADSFARTLSGPAWRDGLLPIEVISDWAHSESLWWRRVALVSTVALNVRSQGGQGDARRTLAICRLLVEDREDMVMKALSWALREVVVHDPRAVRGFIAAHWDGLAARVKREVRNKLDTGLKNR